MLCSLGVVMGVLYSHFTGVQEQQLKDELSLAVTGTEQYGDTFLKNIEPDRFRITWIDTDGTVLFDTQVDQTVMENHADREEIREAMETGSGSAELLESGLVKPEDEGRFVGHIKKEASRLVSLIEDIIRLSQLDEGVELPAEQVDMLALAEDVKEILAPSAAQKNITIHITGSGFTIKGVRRMLHEVVYNLCDNAIKYNIPDGSVKIHVENNRLVVSDTGIGIPAEHQSRIFERFYRVDKSHSKASGGTGLGLSIVKHTVAYHQAQIALESAPGKGTTITVTF